MVFHEHTPLVSIGLPVYNGEKYLKSAIESLLAQNYKNFELIISDNASDDSTRIICEAFQAKDSRIRYYRNEINIGATLNFKKVFDLSQGEYFMWAAHDDVREFEFIKQCVEQLEINPDAVMCMSDLLVIDSEGKTIKEFEAFDTRGKSISENIIKWITRFWWYELYGLIRKKSLNAIDLSREEFGLDVIWVLELILRGQIIRVNKRLFQYRQLTKGSAENVNAITSDEQRRFEMNIMPYTQLVKNLYSTVEKSDLEADLKFNILEQMIATFARDYKEWQNILINENLANCGPLLFDSESKKEQFFYLRITTLLSVQQILKELMVEPLVTMLRRISQERPIMLWGTGSGGQRVYDELSSCSVEISGFIDSDKEKNGQVFNKKTVHSPDIIKGEKPPFIIIASSYVEEIKYKLSKMEYKGKIDFITTDFYTHCVYYME